MTRHLLPHALFAMTAALLPAQNLLKDVNTSPPATTDPGSFPIELHSVAGLTFFQATDATHGAELWVSDGTAAGTRLVSDLQPGPAGSLPRAFTTFQGLACFTCETSGHGVELWRSDGTPAGTQLVADLNPGSASSAPGGYAILGSELYFRATAPGVGLELFATDGTPAGTHLVLDIWSGAADSGPLDLVALGGRLYFSAEEPLHGRELWVSDGSPSGTQLLADLEPGTQSSFARGIVRLGSRLLFSAGTTAAGIELWSSDGTAAGTQLLADIQPGPAHSRPFFLVPIGGLVWFQADDGQRGTELWVSDGTTAGTRMVADVFAGSASSRPEHFTAFGSQVLFVATGPGVGREAYISDGTTAGTRLVTDIRPGTSDGLHHPSTSEVFHPLGTRVVFAADDGVHGIEPWVTDGTAAGTVLLADVNPGSANGSTIFGDELAVLGVEVLFRGYEPTTPPGRGPELWRTDGTPAGTALLANLAKPAPQGSDPRGLVELFDQVLFRVFDGIGVRPWISDGTANGTRLLADVPIPLVYLGVDLEPVSVGDQVLFVARHPASGLEPWITDGTTAGTKLLLDLVPGTGNSNPNELVQFRGRAWFTAWTASYGRELWVTDGSTTGTSLFADLVAGFGSSDPLELTAAGDLLFFAARTSSSGHELWCTDGTQAGTRLVYALTGSDARIHEIASIGTGVLFSADDRVHGTEPWFSDGTTSGTRLLADVRPGSPGSEASRFTAFRPGPGSWSCVFRADDGTHGMEPWVADAAAGTSLLRDVTAGPVGSDPDAFVAITNQRVLFAAADRGVSGSGRELWTTGGTPTTTSCVVDLWLGPGDGLPPGSDSRITAVGDNARALFGATDGAHGLEPWTSDGTAAGTRMLADLRPGPASSAPARFTVAGRRAYFVAVDDAVGQEPFTLELAAIGAAYARPVGAGCAGSSGKAPVLRGNAGPRIGQPFVFLLDQARPNTAACALVGLGPVLMPAGDGCTTYFPMHTVLAYPMTTDAAGRASQSVGIGPDPAWIGLFVHAQAFVADPGAAWQGAVAFTNAVQMLVGN